MLLLGTPMRVNFWGRGLLRAAGAATLLASLAACATPPPADDPGARAAYDEADDPLEPLNRGVFEFNRLLDQLFFRHAGEAYRFALPEGARNGIRNALRNLDTPGILVNDVLQGNLKRASESGQRIVMNTLAGAGGFVDVAAMDNTGDLPPVAYHNEDFGQTLGVWGFGGGPYLVLPVLGPSNVRDLVGRVADGFLDPMDYLIPKDIDDEFGLSRSLAKGLDRRSRTLESLDEIERQSIDFYAAIRSLYRQNRESEIANGAASAMPAPEISLPIDDDVRREATTARLHN